MCLGGGQFWGALPWLLHISGQRDNVEEEGNGKLLGKSLSSFFLKKSILAYDISSIYSCLNVFSGASTS